MKIYLTTFSSKQHVMTDVFIVKSCQTKLGKANIVTQKKSFKTICGFY